MTSRFRFTRRRTLGATCALAFATLALGGGAGAEQGSGNIPYLAATGALRPAVLDTGVVKRMMPFLSSGVIATAQEVNRFAQNSGVGGAPNNGGGGSGTEQTADELGIAPASYGCGRRDFNPQTKTLNGNSGNVRVNQGCDFRRQAEEDITYNPLDPNNLLAGQNDSRLGYNQCGIDFSLDNGARWGDMVPPFRQRENAPETVGPNTILGGVGTHDTYDAASDPTMAFDTRGRSYFSCIVFDVAGLDEPENAASGLYVTQSPAGAKGSYFFNVPPRGRTFMAVEDNNPQVFHDKQFITTDTHLSSPNRDNVYVTWTVFRFTAGLVYQESPIYGSMSTDGARTWSKPEEISGASAELCFFANIFGAPGTPDRCNFNQGSDPVTLPNGDLVVVFNNGNTDINTPFGQQLAVRCRPTGSSTAGTATLGCDRAPRFIDFSDTAGAPECEFGRGLEDCIPGAYIRTNPFPRIEHNQENGNIYVVWQDYRRRDTQAREWSIQISRSVDGGNTWTRAVTVNPTTGLDHYFPAVDIAEVNGADRVGVSYYRTERVPGETDGAFTTRPSCTPDRDDPCLSDYVLAGGLSLEVPYNFKIVSVTFPPPDGIQAGFNGDYSGLTINKGVDAHPIWSDTRNPDPYTPQNGVVHDEDIYTDNVGLPNGKSAVVVGTIK